jgi:hypothetical protein
MSLLYTTLVRLLLNTTLVQKESPFLGGAGKVPTTIPQTTWWWSPSLLGEGERCGIEVGEVNFSTG